MNRILIKNVLLDKNKTNILIENGLFKAIGVDASAEAAEMIDAEGMAILPAFYNTHTHAAMVDMRGYADDMPLQEWLQDWIWPYEEKLTEDDVERGTSQAAREMKACGTVFFNDMYFAPARIQKAVEASGMRASIGITVMENHSKAEEEVKEEFIRNFKDTTGRINLTVAPHAIYTVGKEKLIRSAANARRHGLQLHIHLSETMQEIRDCIREHGTTPVRYLDSIGFLGPDVIAAHCVHVDAEEWDILAERGVTISHCPCSNLKLGSGRFPYELAIRSGARITLGTDGNSSNNNLDMREEMKFAALMAKSMTASTDVAYLEGRNESFVNEGNPSLLPAQEILKWATQNGAEAFGINGGVIAEGKVADCILVDLGDIAMQPCHNLVSNWVYSAQSNIVRKVICDGKVIL